jgi:hypothetical protein
MGYMNKPDRPYLLIRKGTVYAREFVRRDTGARVNNLVTARTTFRVYRFNKRSNYLKYGKDQYWWKTYVKLNQQTGERDWLGRLTICRNYIDGDVVEYVSELL